MGSGVVVAVDRKCFAVPAPSESNRALEAERFARDISKSYQRGKR